MPIAGGCGATLLVRPEHLGLAQAGGDGLPCPVRRIQFLGSIIRYHAEGADASGEGIVDPTRLVGGIEEGSEATLAMAPADSILYHKKLAQ